MRFFADENAAPAPEVSAFKNEAPKNDAGERCIFNNPDCGPVVAHDGHGAPACQKCWDAETAAGTFDPPAPAPGRDAGDDALKVLWNSRFKDGLTAADSGLGHASKASFEAHATLAEALARRAQPAGPDDGAVSRAEVEAAKGAFDAAGLFLGEHGRKALHAALEAARKATPAPGAKHD